MTYNEFDIPAPAEEATREARRNIERAKMRVLHPTEWPEGSKADGKLYSLECSRAQSMEHIDGEFMLTDTPTLGSQFALDKPELTRIEGTYQEVAVYAQKLNDTQGANVHWVYTPALIEPQKVA